jgi:hypothetical protein
MADSAVIAYYNLLRLQGWIGSLCLTVERALFGQALLGEIHGPTLGNRLAEEIARLEDVLMALRGEAATGVPRPIGCHCPS